MNFPPLTAPPIPGMKTIPYGGELMLPAWLACVRATAAEPKAVTAFAEATGMTIPKLPTSPIDRMIDQAAGVNGKVGAAFCDWVTVNVWGEEESAP